MKLNQTVYMGGYMKKITILVIMLCFSALTLQADPWEKSFDLGINLTQNTYSDSWSGGEAGNLTWVAKADGIFQKQIKPTVNFKSTLKFAFGQTHTQDKTSKNWAKPEKSTDKIDIENLFRLTQDWGIDPYFAVRFESQFLDASVDGINRYFNPMLWTESAGISHVVYKTETDELLTRLGVAYRQNVQSVIVDTIGDMRNWETATDGGLESVTDFKYTISESLNYIGKMSLYKALIYSDKDVLEGTPMQDDWKSVDVNFENSFSASVAKYITVSLYIQVLYDKQINKKSRLKESLAMGLTYKLF